MTNVYEFPKHKIVREVLPNIDEIEKAKEKSLVNFADSVVDDLITTIYAEFENYGLDIESEFFEKDFYFAMDSVKASVYRILGIKHNLHEFIDNSVSIKKVEAEDGNEEKNDEEKTE